MYCKFFGFTEKPFDVTPDPEFLYLSPSHREMLASLTYGIRERRGIITVVGEVGTGKTTLLNALLARLDGRTSAAFIFNTNMTFDEILSMTLHELKLAKPEENVTKLEAIRRLNDLAIRQLARGGNVVLLVDEAQNLDRFDMENLRLLSNLETRKHKLIQIVLSGQPELDIKLNQPELRQLAQRIAVKRYITPLREKETYEYIRHRLRIANYSGPPLFRPRARKMIWEYSGGIPRKINVLCDNALLIAYALQRRTIKASVIEEAVRDLSWSPFSGPREAQGADRPSPNYLTTGKPALLPTGHGGGPGAHPLNHASCRAPAEAVPAQPVEDHADPPVVLDPRRPSDRDRSALGPALEPSPDLGGSENGTAEVAPAGNLSAEGVGEELQSPGVQDPRRPVDRARSALGPVLEPSPDFGGSENGTAGIQNQKPMADLEPSPSETEESSGRIFYRACAKWARDVLNTILGRNSEIQSLPQARGRQVVQVSDKKQP